jgi:glutamate synthase domain-containing protein 2/glutamate synthase domain-containing protein 1/glutamate synthase domain-containing protein 3
LLNTKSSAAQSIGRGAKQQNAQPSAQPNAQPSAQPNAQSSAQPSGEGLWHPAFEHDSCGIGMLVDIGGKRSHKLVEDAVQILEALTHRGGVGYEPETGDGAGILIQIPDEFMRRVTTSENIALPGDEGSYGIAMMFASPDAVRCKESIDQLCQIITSEGMEVLGVRKVPTNPDSIGPTALSVLPSIHQVFIRRPLDITSAAFERKLYVVSQIAQRAIRMATQNRDPYFYLASISASTIVYKGMLLPSQLTDFYLDLKDSAVTSAIALVHSRFSTNTFPSWERAHPMRHIIHNGEINTIRGNVNWVKAREARMRSELFGADLARVFPAINEDGSDSAMLDDFLRLMMNSGVFLHEAVLMAIPEPWEENEQMDDTRRALFEYLSCLVEPWDGPASVAFTDGRFAGAVLDRNGLRPSRYYVTDDGLLILASEVGVLPIDEAHICRKDRLRPGRMLLIDTAEGRIIEDAELKATAAAKHPYQQWLDTQMLKLTDLPLEPEQASTRAADTASTTSAVSANIADAAPLSDDPLADVPLARAKQTDSISLSVPLTLNDLLARAKQQAAGKASAAADLLSLERLAKRANTNQDLATPLSILQQQKAFGYNWEDLNLTLKPLAQKAEDPVSSMGYDAPLAVLSNRPQLLYSFFKQHFAQVTNPPIDAIREHLITSSYVHFGSEGNLLEPTADNCRVIRHDTPVLAASDMARLRVVRAPGLAAITLPCLFDAHEPQGLSQALEDLFLACEYAIDQGFTIIILSDRGLSEHKAPIPALLATSGLHHHLVRKGIRTQVSIVVETGEAREAHHVALLVGYGANGVFPYLAFASIEQMVTGGLLEGPPGEALDNYRSGLTSAIIKIASKMGISTVRSYHGAQIFEALGIATDVVERYFSGTVSRIGGVGMADIQNDVLARQRAAFQQPDALEALDSDGDYKWRSQGEYHLLNPQTIYYLQQACRSGSYELFQKFSAAINDHSQEYKNIRGLLEIITVDKPIPIETVEPVEEIVQRFKTGAMSYGSISREAHECLAIAMNRLKGKSNTGEGGEDSARFVPGEDGENRCSAIKQVASGRFGVTIHYLNNAQEIQIKMAQGAKPGEGGHLPGKKVYPWVAGARFSTPGVELISPPPHHDIYSIEDLAQLIFDLKNANRDARISVKLVSEAGVGTIAVGVAKGLADVIVISGYDGGTGAAPRTSIRHAGLPWELGVAETHQSLLQNRLRNRVSLETDGKLFTGRDIVIAALLGAEEFAFATAPLIALGCDMLRVCNLDTCAVGIATQNPQLREQFCGRPEHVENLMRFIAQEVREWMARMGVRHFRDLIGHVEFLRQTQVNKNCKAAGVDLSRLLHQNKVAEQATDRFFTQPQDHKLSGEFDLRALLPLCQPAVDKSGLVNYRLRVSNRNRTVGTVLSSEIVRRHGADGLPTDSINLELSGAGGQSFGAFLAPGITLTLRGDTNDYLGKGLSGGRIIVTPPPEATYKPSENIIVGNVAFYGATQGEAFICGVAGERFCVRNSGVRAVVEGVGDHGCEYMTGGRAVILGSTGRNFAAGMSGGIAYIYNPDGNFARNCNRSSVLLHAVDEDARITVRELLEKHYRFTGSDKAGAILANFEQAIQHFVVVIPKDFQKILNALKEAERQNIASGQRALYAFNSVILGKAAS